MSDIRPTFDDTGDTDHESTPDPDSDPNPDPGQQAAYTYRDRCAGCDASMVGVDVCAFCARCDNYGIMNGRNKWERNRRRRELAEKGGGGGG